MRVLGKFVVCPALLLAALAATLLARPLPALAFWGDYGQEPPSFFGVQLGSDIRDYPDMLRRDPSDEDEALAYYREADSAASIAGVRVQKHPSSKRPINISYLTYKNKIFRIHFNIFLDDFEKIRRHMADVYGSVYIPETAGETYTWGLYEVSVKADGYYPIPGNAQETARASKLAEGEKSRDGNSFVGVEVLYLPVINEMYKREFNNFKAKYRGVVLGSKAANYSFLRPYKREAPDLTSYRSAKPLGMVKGLPVIAEDYAAYKGVIYRIEITSDEWDLRYENSSSLFSVSEFIGLKTLYDSPPYAFKTLGDSDYAIAEDSIIYTHMPTYWRAMRAKMAYHRNVKPD